MSEKSFYLHRLIGSVFTNVLYKTQKIEIHGSSILAAATGFGFQATVQGCISTVPITMISSVAYQDSVTKNIVTKSDLTGMCDFKSIEQKINNFSSEKTARSVLTNSFSRMKIIGTGCNIDTLRTEYLNCPSDQYFYIPLTLVPFFPISIKPMNHANGILIQKSKGKVFRIEPQYYASQMQKTDENYQETEKSINNAIIQLVDSIGLKSPTFINITVPCPQAIVEDRNCIFWSLYIFEAILQNLYKEPDPNKVIQQISSKPKQELEDLIYKFKQELFNVRIPNFLKSQNITWPDYDKNKEQINKEIYDEYAKIKGIPIPANPPRLGGKTYRRKRIKKSKKTKRKSYL